MRAKITNTSKANQGVWTDSGLETIEPGKTRTLTIAKDYVERAKSLPFLTVQEVSPLDRDEDGHDGGSLAHEPPALTGKTKAQLLEIAAAEEVEIEDGATNADIVSAIELAREAKAD